MRTLMMMPVIAMLAGFPLLASDNTAKNTSSAGTREDLSTLAGNMLNETNAARAAIKKGNRLLAQQHVERAERDLQAIESRANGRTMIPVYQEFVSVSILGPVQAEQNAKHASAQTAEKPVKVGNKAVVHEVAGDYTSVVVNTTVAKNSLAAAKSALAKADLLTADSALADLQEGVEIRSDEADMPLAEVRENLVIARASARNGKFEEAQAGLRAASEALSTYAHEGGSHANEAKAMEQEIRTYNQDLSQNHADVVTKINEWWNKIADWSPYKAQEQLSAKQ